ncbi:hypothetical protein ABW19_dt0207133 [Dactylella cylindrospora]|nr:hypothetical protein ABW19_dt0207133 [Dactylella cylindrospora]
MPQRGRRTGAKRSLKSPVASNGTPFPRASRNSRLLPRAPSPPAPTPAPAAPGLARSPILNPVNPDGHVTVTTAIPSITTTLAPAPTSNSPLTRSASISAVAGSGAWLSPLRKSLTLANAGIFFGVSVGIATLVGMVEQIKQGDQSHNLEVWQQCIEKETIRNTTLCQSILSKSFDEIAAHTKRDAPLLNSEGNFGLDHSSGAEAISIPFLLVLIARKVSNKLYLPQFLNAIQRTLGPWRERFVGIVAERQSEVKSVARSLIIGICGYGMARLLDAAPQVRLIFARLASPLLSQTSHIPIGQATEPFNTERYVSEHEGSVNRSRLKTRSRASSFLSSITGNTSPASDFEQQLLTTTQFTSYPRLTAAKDLNVSQNMEVIESEQRYSPSDYYSSSDSAESESESESVLDPASPPEEVKILPPEVPNEYPWSSNPDQEHQSIHDATSSKPSVDSPDDRIASLVIPYQAFIDVYCAVIQQYTQALDDNGHRYKAQVEKLRRDAYWVDRPEKIPPELWTGRTYLQKWTPEPPRPPEPGDPYSDSQSDMDDICMLAPTQSLSQAPLQNNSLRVKLSNTKTFTAFRILDPSDSASRPQSRNLPARPAPAALQMDTTSSCQETLVPSHLGVQNFKKRTVSIDCIAKIIGGEGTGSSQKTEFKRYNTV